MMRIEDFCDMDKFENIMDNWAKSTGLATVAVVAAEVQKLAKGMGEASAETVACPRESLTGMLSLRR